MSMSSDASQNYPHPAALEIDSLLKECRSTRARRGGPGGQHRNKVETAFLIEHLPTGVAAEANERRSQEENRKVAIHRLRVRLAVVVRYKPSLHAEPSALWRKRRVGAKIEVSEAHEDYPAILAEALDRIAIADYQFAAAAQALEVSTSSLIRLIAKSSEAITVVNKERTSRNMPKLHINH